VRKHFETLHVFVSCNIVKFEPRKNSIWFTWSRNCWTNPHFGTSSHIYNRESWL